MTVAHHGLLGGGTIPPVIPENTKSPPSTTTQPMGIDSTKFFNTLLRIEINRSPNDNTSYPIKPFLKEFLRELQKVDSDNNILPIKETTTDGPIAMESDVPTGDRIHKYVAAFQDSTTHKNKNVNMILFHVRIAVPRPYGSSSAIPVSILG